MRGILGLFIFARLPLPGPLAIVLSIGVLIAVAGALIHPIMVAVRTGDTTALRRHGRAIGQFVLRVIVIIALFIGLAAVLLFIR